MSRSQMVKGRSKPTGRPTALPGNCAAENVYIMRKCALCCKRRVVYCTRCVVSITNFSLEMKNIGLVLCEVHCTL